MDLVGLVFAALLGPAAVVGDEGPSGAELDPTDGIVEVLDGDLDAPTAARRRAELAGEDPTILLEWLATGRPVDPGGRRELDAARKSLG